MTTPTKLAELPIEVQEQLTADRLALSKQNHNNAYEINIYSTDGYRRFFARRVAICWNDDKGHSMPFGGGSVWKICFSKVGFKSCRNPLGQMDYCIVDGARIGRILDDNGAVVYSIPSEVATKKEALDVLRTINDLLKGRNFEF